MAKKYSNKVPRKQKKEIKKKAGLQGQSVPKTEVVNLANKEAQKQRRKENAARRYNENKALLESVGLSTSIITKSTSQKETRRLVEEEKKRQRTERNKFQKQALYESKIARLKEAGFSDMEARGVVGTYSHQISNARIDEIVAEKSKAKINDRIRLTSNEWLYVGYAETNDDMDMQTFANFTTDELLDLIRMRYNEATLNPTGSDAMTGVFVVDSGSKSVMEEIARDYYSRGYKFKMSKGHVKLDSNRYYKMTLNNTYTQHNFLQLVATVICNAKNEMVSHYMQQFKIYCNEAGFPFLDDL